VSAPGPARTRRRAASAVAGLLLLPSPASAHGSAKLGDFYAGLAQPVYHPESLLLVLALALFVARDPERPAIPSLFAFVAATLAGAGVGLAAVPLPGVDQAVRLGALAVGLVVVTAWRAPRIAAAAVAAVLGAAHGHLAAFADRALVDRPVLFVLGLGLAPLLVASWIFVLCDRVRAPWLQIGLRVLGSWIATIALLVAALECAAPPG